MSCDLDFMPLAMRVRQDGIPVYGFGSAKTPEGFQGACTRFIDVDALVDAGREQGGADRKATAKKAIEPDVTELPGHAWTTAKRYDNGYPFSREVGPPAGKNKKK